MSINSCIILFYVLKIYSDGILEIFPNMLFQFVLKCIHVDICRLLIQYYTVYEYTHSFIHLPIDEHLNRFPFFCYNNAAVNILEPAILGTCWVVESTDRSCLSDIKFPAFATATLCLPKTHHLMTPNIQLPNSTPIMQPHTTSARYKHHR